MPPGHPKAKITEAASHVREMIQNQIHMEPDQDDLEDDSEDDEEEDEHAMDLDSDMVNILFSEINIAIVNLFSKLYPKSQSLWATVSQNRFELRVLT